jgi:hypothetical protein
MNNVYLDGKLVSINDIDPTKHSFIGTFRSPNPPDGMGINDKGIMQQAAVIFCPCGSHLWNKESTQNHWQQGHFDIPQYKTIEYGKSIS